MSVPSSRGESPATNGSPSAADIRRLQEVLTPRSPLGFSTSAAPRFKLVCEIGRDALPALAHPLTLALDADGNILTVERPEPDRFRLRRFAPDGHGDRTLAEFGVGTGETEVTEPASLACDIRYQMYVLDASEGALKKYTADGRWLDTFSSAGSNGTPLERPQDVDVDADGNMYIADTNNDRIVKLLPDGELGWALERFAAEGEDDEPDEFYEPNSLCLADEGNLYVADSNQNRIVRFDVKGKLVSIVGDDKLFRFPTRVRASKKEGSLYVADNSDQRVQRFDQTGRKTGTMSLVGGGPAGADFVAGADFAVDRSGHVVMINPSRDSIVVFAFLEP